MTPHCLLCNDSDGKERIKHMARPKKENHPISIRMDKAIYDRLNEFCDVSGQPKTVAIERAVAAYVNAYSHGDNKWTEKNDSVKDNER